MPENLAKVVTKDQVIAALEHLIAHPEIELTAPTKFYYTYKGHQFPPKEVVRWAARLGKIRDWEQYNLQGGPPTNQYLEALGIPGAAIIAKGETAKDEIAYFDFEGMEKYKELAGTTYNAAHPDGRSWFRDTESKLEYLVTLLSEQLDELLSVNYKQRPNQQAGRGKIVFSDYVLVGCCPVADKQDDSVFIKLAFHNLSGNTSFTIEIDSNKRLEGNKFIQFVEPLRVANSWSIPVDGTFPDNWEALLNTIKPVFEKHFSLYKQVKMLAPSTEIKSKAEEERPVYKTIYSNVILYGPPGTGKTYHSINHALSIIEGEIAVSDLNTKGGRNAVMERYDELRKQGYIEFITFHQNYSYEEFVQGLRPKIESANQLMFEKRDGVFKKLADEALKNLIESSTKEVSVEPTFDEVFDEFFKPLIDETDTISIQMESKDYQFLITKYNPEIENFSFTKQSGGQGHAIYIPTLKKYFEQIDINHTQGLKYYYRPLAKAMHKKAEQLKKVVSNVKRKNYVLIIDEINRANISRVFGELITLLEEDKRWDNKHKMKVRLPSGDEFTIPKNLYIIGTMNTADKSIALVDIALRRRFRFEPMYPDSTIEGVRHGDILDKLNAAILQKKGADFLVGHSYFMNDEYGHFSLSDTMNFKVIPLLNEYFYNQRGDVVKTIIETAIAGTGMKVEKDNYGQLQFMEGE